jgi:hypothetical protein
VKKAAAFFGMREFKNSVTGRDEPEGRNDRDATL